VELPTYTNIWKIEKRLYKLYDFRLPMPLPVGQIAAFLAIAVPYTIILTMVGMPFSHTWLWVYVLPPGILAWLVTRPVLEGKRLPELASSQLRYLAEPRTWCRMAPLVEKDAVVLTARVWRSARYVRPASQLPALATPARPDLASTAAAPSTANSATGKGAAAWPQRRPRPEPRTGPAIRPAAPRPSWPVPVRERATSTGAVEPSAVEPSTGEPSTGEPITVKSSTGEPSTVAPGPGGSGPGAARPVWPNAAPARRVTAAPSAPVADLPELTGTGAVAQPAAGPATSVTAPSAAAAVQQAPRPATQDTAPPAEAGPPQAPPPRRPVVRVNADATATRPLNVVERALRNPPGPAGSRDPVIVVPGGHRPGKPDQVQRDQARVRLALSAPARIVVLGCTGGAGQTVTTLLTGQLLASLRDEPVAVLDLATGQGTLTEQARLIPVLLPRKRVSGEPSPLAGGSERGLQVVTARDSSQDPDQIISAVAARYPLTLADPDAGRVPRTLRAADQLVLVAPATGEASASLAMTLEWLEAHGHAALATGAITVLNGVSPATAEHADRAAAVARGRCRAIVQVPWDEHVRARRALGTGTIHAYTALAGVLVATLAGGQAQPAQPAPHDPAQAGAVR
jgi:MinD-like ATPase involved in chromosome partitioning or flagellar assembly